MHAHVHAQLAVHPRPVCKTCRGLQELPAAQDLKRLLTMSHQQFVARLVAPFRPQRARQGRLVRFPPPSSAPAPASAAGGSAASAPASSTPETSSSASTPSAALSPAASASGGVQPSSVAGAPGSVAGSSFSGLTSAAAGSWGEAGAPEGGAPRVTTTAAAGWSGMETQGAGAL